MARRLHSHWISQLGDNYTINIYDDSYSGASTYVPTVDASINAMANNNKIQTPIRGRELKYSFVLDRLLPENADILLMLRDLADEVEDRFWCKVERNESTYFIGQLVIDQVKVPNHPVVSISFSFVDGIAMLKDLEYVDGDNTTIDLEEPNSLFHALTTCLALIPSRTRYNSNDVFLTLNNLYAHDKFTGNEYWKEVGVKNGAWIKEDDEGLRLGVSVYDVLEALCNAFYMEIRWDDSVDSAYVMDRVNGRKTSSAGYAKYDNEFNFISQSNIDVDNVGAIYPLKGGHFTYLAGLNRAYFINDFKQDNEIERFSDKTTFEDYGSYVVRDEDTIFTVHGIIDWDWHSTRWQPFDVAFWFLFNIRLEGETTGNQYFVNKIYAYDSPFTTPDDNFFIEVRYPPDRAQLWRDEHLNHGNITHRTKLKKGNHSNYTFYSIAMKPSEHFQLGERVSIKIQSKYRGWSVLANRKNKDWITINDYFISCSVTQSQGYDAQANKDVKLAYVSNFGNKNSLKLDHSSYLGNTQNSYQNLLVLDGGEWKPIGDTWGGNSDDPLAKLVLSEIHQNRAKTIDLYKGQIYGKASIDRTFTYPDSENKKMIMLAGTKSLATDKIDGHFYFVNFLGEIDNLTITSVESGGKSVNVINGGSSSDSGNSRDATQKIAFRVSEQSGSEVLLMPLTDIPIDEVEVDDLYVHLVRDNTVMRLSETPNKMEYKVVIGEFDLKIELGKEAVESNIFWGYIEF